MFFFLLNMDQVLVDRSKTDVSGLYSNLSFVLPEYLDELKQYTPTYTQWAESEEDLAEPLKGVAGCVDRCSKETEEHINHMSEVLVPALHEYVLCAETVKVSPHQTAHMQTPPPHWRR